MRVLSLFDGISCARVALERAGIPIEAYYACEIEKNAIKVSQKNYPDIQHLGSVVGLTPPLNIDLLVGGSPCQDLSIAKKDRKGLDGERSGLFWEYVRIKNETKPKYFILENVSSMPKEAKDIITKEMGVEPVMFNASLVSAQCRKRLFWTNIPFELPEDKGILLKHILQPDAEVDERMVVDGKSYCLTATYNGATETNSVARKQRTMVFTKTAQTGRNETKKLGYISSKDHQANRVYDDEGKLPALASVCNSMVKVGYIGEGEQNGQGGQAHRVYSADGKTPTLSSFGPLVKVGSIRKLTPIECERLQGLPDNYTEGIAMTNRYKCLGNAFNVDVVSWILKNIKKTRVIQKNTLSFSCSKSMKFLRTPADLWAELSAEFPFTIDICASHDNHLLPRYYTIEDSALTKDWTGEVAYIHPLFDGKIGKFVEKAFKTKNLTAVFLLPSSTHTKYFHECMYKNPNCEIRFLRKPNKGFRFGKDDGSEDDPNSIGYIKALMVVVMRNP